MKFSLPMLSNLLARHDIKSRALDGEDRFFSNIQLYTTGWSVWEPDVLYVMTARDYAGAALPEGSAAVILGEPGTPPVGSCLLVRSECSVEELLNALLSSVSQLLGLEKQLISFMVERSPFSAALSALSRFMQNPAYAMDSRFKLLAIDSDEDLMYSSLTLKRLKEHGYMPIQTVVKILNSRTWTQVHATAEPVLMKMDEFYCPFINCAIQFHGQFQGYLIVVGLAHDLNQGDLDLVKQIMPIIDRIAMSDIEVSTGRGSYYEHFLLDMIRGNLRDRVLIAEQMTPLGWSLRDRYVAMAARLVPQRNDLNDTFFLRISQLFEGKPVITEDRLFCVFRLKKEQDYEQLVREMRKLCDLCKFKVGLSGVFADFTQLSAQAGLAGRTLDMGLTRSPGSFVYLASDYRLFCLFDIGRTQMDLREFIPPELQLLEQHDLENNTEYVHTLYVYLTHERNWVTTSEALHIHRNSLRYRIERLENMTGLSLDDADTRLRLLLAYEIKKYFDKLG